MKIILALLIFSGIVLFHEFGHFMGAKLSGITVTEFSLGFGPRLISKQWGQTRYSIKLLWLGGSCAMLGEDTDEESLPGSFNSASVWKRICVVAGGPIFNFILALVLSTIIVGFMGYSPATITKVKEGSNAEAAGLEVGDVITSYNGSHVGIADDVYLYSFLDPIEEGKPLSLTLNRDGETISLEILPDVTTRYLLGFNRSDADSMTIEGIMEGMALEEAGLQAGDVITSVGGVETPDGAAYEAYLKDHPLDGSEITITYRRDGKEYEATVIPKEYNDTSIGFSYNTAYEKVHGIGVLKEGWERMTYMLRMTVLSLKGLFTGRFGVSDLSGPVGVVDAIGQTYEISRPQGMLVVIMNLLDMAVLLSANLGVMNLLPFPALDGGRLVFLFVEAIRRKSINRNVEGMIHLAGMALLMVLMVVIMYNDILKLI